MTNEIQWLNNEAVEAIRNSGRSGRGPSRKHMAIADELRKSPGQWAMVMEAKTGQLASRISAGEITAYAPKGAFEAFSRAGDNGLYRIYARFVDVDEVSDEPEPEPEPAAEAATEADDFDDFEVEVEL